MVRYRQRTSAGRLPTVSISNVAGSFSTSLLAFRFFPLASSQHYSTRSL